ncbi:MAG: hypothetical protein V1689_07820 [Pseudomonadota bacterium]
MKILHVLKSEPDEVIKRLMEPTYEGNEVQQFELHTGDVDYDELVKQVFEHDKVVCWW